MAKNEIITPNVTGKKLKWDGSGKSWEVDGQKYGQGWAYSKTKEGMTMPGCQDKAKGVEPVSYFADISYCPVGFELKGDIIKHTSTHIVDQRPVYRTEVVFQPHDGQIDDVTAMKHWRDNWLKHDPKGEHFYSDVEQVTYTCPETKKKRTDYCYGISIQHEVNVIVWRSHRGRPTMAIPIKNIIKKHIYEKYK